MARSERGDYTLRELAWLAGLVFGGGFFFGLGFTWAISMVSVLTLLLTGAP